MTLRIDIMMATLAATLAGSPPALAQAPADAPPERPVAEPASKEEVKALTEEVRRLKEELGLRDVEYASYAGMGPGASKVYFAPKGLSLGGYGELNYVHALGAGSDESDLYRLVLYTGYRFTDRIVFNAEVEFEHHDEVSVEFAYLDFLLRDEVSLRVGNVLVPMGFVNLVHEPPFFHGVFRPEVERRIIPTTWNENGLGAHGKLGAFGYQAYGLVGLDAFHEGEDGLEPRDWLRGARTGGGESRAETLAGVVAVGWEGGPVSAGASYYRGKAGQGTRDALGTVGAAVSLLDVHAQVAWRGLQVRGLYARGTLGDAARIADVRGDAGVLGSTVHGWYLEAAYDVLGSLAPDAGQSLAPFVRYEVLDLQAEVPTGFQADRTLAYGFLTTGLTYRPIPNVAVKADYQRKDPEAGPAAEQVDLGVGFAF